MGIYGIIFVMEDCGAKIKVPTTGVFDFPSLILGGGKYVDKTELLYQLAAPKTDTQYFISRPRRFGKSLMLSTLKAMFEGRRELFKGFAIDKLPWEGWEQPTPVYSFTMSRAVGGTYELFREQLAKLVKSLCAEANVEYTGEGDISGQFDDFLVAAAKKSPTGKIAVLIDEYDEPVAKFDTFPDDDGRHETDEALGFLWIEPSEGPFDGQAFRDAPRLHAGGAGRALARKR